MDRAQVHFELFVRRHARAPWTLALATEDRAAAFEAADEVSANDRGAAVRLMKETRDPETGEFRPLVLVERGVKPEPRWRRPGLVRSFLAAPVRRPSCLQPSDLYGTPARQAIGRHLGPWLARNRVTPFELLHRADLAEWLEVCQTELSAALSAAALEQAGSAGAAMTSIRRGLEALTGRTIDRIVHGDPEAGFQLGVVVAGRLERCKTWGEKTSALLDLLDAVSGDDPSARATTRLVQQPLFDILGFHGELAEMFGETPDPGDQMLILVQIAMAPDVASVAARTPALAGLVRPLYGLAARLALTLHSRPALFRTRWAMVRRVTTVLASDVMLWPSDPAREIEGLRALAALLSRAARLADPDDVTNALAARWRLVARPALVETRLAQCAGPLDQATLLLDLMGEVVGRAAAAFLGQRLMALLADPAFERALSACWDDAERDRRLAHIGERAGERAPDLLPEVQRRLRRLRG